MTEKLDLTNDGRGSDIHRIKMSKAMMERTKLTDKQIDEVKALLREGMNYTNIAKKYDVDRHYISDIDKNKIVKSLERNDEFFEKRILENKTREEEIKACSEMNSDDLIIHNNSKNSISKSSLNINQMIEILRLKGKNIPATKVCDHVSFQVSPNVVKSLWNGTKKIYERSFEGTDMTYKEYLDIVAMKCEINREVIRGLISLSCRALDIDTIILILQLKKQGYTQKEILEKLKSMDAYADKNITIDMIKKLLCGRTQVREEEFNNKSFTYAEYLDIVK